MSHSGAPPPRGPFWTPGGVSGGPEPSRSGGSIWLGLGIGVIASLTVWFAAQGLSSDSSLGLTLLLASPVLLVVAGIVLAANPATRRTGAGLLIFVGAAVLILGGLCLALVAALGGFQ